MYNINTKIMDEISNYYLKFHFTRPSLIMSKCFTNQHLQVLIIYNCLITCKLN